MADQDEAQHVEADAPMTTKDGFPAFLGNLQEGLRMAALLGPRKEALSFSWGQLLALVAINLALGFVAQLVYIGFEGEFQADALPNALFLVPELLLAWLLGCLARDPLGAGRYLICLFALAIPANLANCLLFLAYPHLMTLSSAWLQWSLGYCPLLWYVSAAMFAAVRLFSLKGGRAVAAAGIAFALLLAPQFIMNDDRWLWVSRPDSDAAVRPEDYFAAVSEDNIYRQPQLLSDALARLESGRDGEVDLYFIGVAGYASQDVFMKETNSVAQLFDERFGTQGRSLRLINNAVTIAEVPIASKTALQQAFQRIAGLMNKDEDILFLFMTSHGSKEHKFSLDFGMMRFNDVDPPILRRLLDESGIRRRVIVVSACYSGGFVDALKDENTLVITAAAADKNSFGCANENDYTYFGKAYFDESLRRTYSFVTAFEMAKPLIAEREKKDNYTPSDPQIFVGKDIAPVLEAFARNREQAPKRAGN